MKNFDWRVQRLQRDVCFLGDDLLYVVRKIIQRCAHCLFKGRFLAALIERRFLQTAHCIFWKSMPFGKTIIAIPPIAFLDAILIAFSAGSSSNARGDNHVVFNIH